jgi:hypothetical protein
VALIEAASFQKASYLGVGEYSKDREYLGLTLLSCMDGPGSEQLRTSRQVRQYMKDGKLFGIEDPSPWIGTEDLVDFITFLFRDRTVSGITVSELHHKATKNYEADSAA